MSVPLSDFMGASMGKVREMIDVNTVVGDPIHTDDGVTIIPVSKVSFGFAGGASDIPSKHVPPEKSVYGGGTGASVTISPIAFLIVKEGTVRILPIAEPATTSADRIIELVPDLVDRILALIQEKKKDENSEI